MNIMQPLVSAEKTMSCQKFRTLHANPKHNHHRRSRHHSQFSSLYPWCGSFRIFKGRKVRYFMYFMCSLRRECHIHLILSDCRRDCRHVATDPDASVGMTMWHCRCKLRRRRTTAPRCTYRWSSGKNIEKRGFSMHIMDLAKHCLKNVCLKVNYNDSNRFITFTWKENSWNNSPQTQTLDSTCQQHFCNLAILGNRRLTNSYFIQTAFIQKSSLP